MAIQIGPFELGGANGFGIKPQMRVGAAFGGGQIGCGIGDLRDGFIVDSGASAGQSFHGKGKTIGEFLRNLKAGNENGQFAKFIANLMTILPNLIGQISKTVGLDLKVCKNFKGTGTLQIGVGGSAKVAMGVRDPQGFRMMGAGGDATLGLSGGVSVFAGKHENDHKVKILVSVSNIAIKCVAEF